MPSSIFPGPIPGGGAPLLPSANLAAYTRQSTSRRAGPSPLGTGARRPLRSSPLAGPSLALGTDGTLTGSEDEDDAPRVRYRPNRISSTPEMDAGTYEKLRTSASASAPATPTGSPALGHRQFVLEVAVPAERERERVIDLNAEERVLVITTSPTSTSPTSLSPASTGPPSPVAAPATAKQHRRLSLGLKRLSALPGLPSLHRRTTSRDEPRAAMAEPAPRRSRTVSGPAPSPSSPTKAGQTVPPVPSIPEWARIAVLSPEPSGGQSRDKGTRRPSTAPTSPTFLSPTAAASSSSLGSTKSSRHRHSHDQQYREPPYQQQPNQQPHQLQLQHPPQPQSHPHPSPEQQPHRPFAPVHPPPTQHAEASWMTSAASPRFSRLGLKGAGVVLPVSANTKEAKAIRRRSNASALGLGALTDGADGHSVRSARSVRSVRSVASSGSRRERSAKGKEREGAGEGGEGESDVEPPSAPFMHAGARRGSSSASECSGSSIASVGSIGTLGSTASSASAEEATPASSVCSVGSLALAPSRSAETVTETEGEKETEGGAGVLPTVLEERERERGKKGGIELRVNDVTVDVLDYVHEGARAGVGRKGTLKGAGTGCEKAKGNGKGTERVKEREVPAEARREKGAEVRRGGTLKRMWKRVVGHGDR